MAHYKLILEDDCKAAFSLVAIHCTVESYKMAFLLNKYLGLRLKREARDLDFSKDGLEITFPLFEFHEEQHYSTYHLVGNKCKSVAAHTVASGGLFGEEVSEEVVTTYLVPEHKQIDFLLKISSENNQTPLRKLLLQLNEIDQIISAYVLETATLKSKDNLIFD